MSEYILEMKDICKSFPGVKALDHVQLSLKPGHVHALMGENGAGKSTLMKCLFGIYKKDSGQIIYQGEEINNRDPFEALNRGIAMVHQELLPIEDRSIAENIYVGRYPVKKIGPISVIDHAKLYKDAQNLLDDLDLPFDARSKLGTLTASQMQLVEICKALSANAKIVILDEPTSSLTLKEVDKLFEIIHELTARGCGVIYISHKMEEILQISDEVTIMRDGQYIGTWDAKDLTTDLIIEKEVGRMYQLLESIIPGQYVNIVALPYGSPEKISDDKPQYQKILSGTYEGMNYTTKATLLCAWTRSYSPFVRDYNKTAIRRIRAYDNDGVYWDIQDNFKQLNNGKRYISDGDPDTIVYPSEDNASGTWLKETYGHIAIPY